LSGAGLKMQFQLLNTESFHRIGAELSPHGLPGNYKKALYSTEYLERFVRSQTMSGHHPVGTCKMGSTRDLSAVVDPELKYAATVACCIISSSQQTPHFRTWLPRLLESPGFYS